MIPKQIFCYWEGNLPRYIDYCIQTIKDKCGVPMVVLDKETCLNYAGDCLNNNWKKITNIAQKADCLRLAVLYNNGGMWIDADTLFLSDCSHLFDTDVDFVGIRWTHIRDFCNAYWLCQKGSVFIKACIDSVNKDLVAGKKYYPSPGGGYFGSELLGRVEREGDFKVKDVPMDTFIPVNFPLRPSIWNDILDIEPWITKHTVAIALTNSQFGENIRQSTVEYLAGMNNLLGSALRYSGMDIKPAIPEKPECNTFKKFNLPENFGPGHKKWDIPSFRQRYLVMVGAIQAPGFENPKPKEAPVVISKKVSGGNPINVSMPESCDVCQFRESLVGGKCSLRYNSQRCWGYLWQRFFIDK